MSEANFSPVYARDGKSITGWYYDPIVKTAPDTCGKAENVDVVDNRKTRWA